jgi:ABC-2 type transport system permease protein
MLRSAHVAWLYLRVGAMNEMQYRANFVVQIFQAMVALGTGLVALGLIFSHTKTLDGWTGPQLLAVMGIYTIIGAVVASIIQPNMQQLMDDIQRGNFDYVLTKPVDAQVMASVRQVQIWQAVDLLTGLIVLGIALSRIGSQIGLLETLGFLTMILLGAVLIYCFWLILTTVAFWVVRLDQIVDLFEGVFAAGRYPVGIYPFWLRFGLTFLVPVAFAVTVPAEAVTGRLTWETVLGAIGLTVLFLAFARILWRLGLRRYSGASA